MRVLVNRREFDSRPGLANIYDIRGSENIVFGSFFRGGNSTNPVEESQGATKYLSWCHNLSLVCCAGEFQSLKFCL